MESCKVNTVTLKTPEKDPLKAAIVREKLTKKSVKSSTKKSKPSPIDSVTSNVETPLTKDMEHEQKSTQSEEERTSEKNVEVPSSESNKLNEGTFETPVEAVKPKVKKKKKVLNSSKSEDTSVENAQTLTGEVGVVESSLKATDVKSNLDESSSRKAKGVVLKTEVGNNKISKNADVCDKILKNSVSSSKECCETKTFDVPKTAGVKTKKSHGDLSPGKLGSGTDKLSGAEEPAAPIKPVERRRSKIFDNADKFSIFLGGSDPKSPTAEKPKKVFIPGVKVSDYKQAFERRSSLSSTSLPTPVKNSTSKKAVEQNSKIVPTKSSSHDNGNVDASRAVKNAGKSSEVTELMTEPDLNTLKQLENSQSLKQGGTLPDSFAYNQLSVESSAPETDEANSVGQCTKLNKEGSNEGENICREKTLTADTAKDEEADLKLVPALQVTDKMSHQEKARIKKLKDAVEIISNAIAEESKRESDPTALKKITSSKPPVPSSPDKPRAKSAGNSNSSSPKSPPVSPTDASSGKRTIRVQVGPNDIRLATVQVSTPQSTNFPFDVTSIAKQSTDKGSESPSEKQSTNEENQSKDSSSVNKVGIHCILIYLICFYHMILSNTRRCENLSGCPCSQAILPKEQVFMTFFIP